MAVSPIRVVLALAVWGLLMMSATAYYVWYWLHNPQTITVSESVYIIERGATLHGVAADLHEKNMMRWPRLWVFYARLLNLQKIQAGEYSLAPKESPNSLLSRFQTGEHVRYHITLVEGYTLKEFIRTLHSHKKITLTLGGMSYDEIITALGIHIQHPEGYFFPDTYQFIRGDTDRDILLRAHRRMTEILNEEWVNRENDLPYDSAYQALVMASIVEKETGAAFERRQIAGVFVHRLQKSMRLQTDPTVIYGMGESYHGNITRKDLKTTSPYNTYLIKGLPPTPIANPGRAAIHAALHPSVGNALYFVAKGDGTHYFSATLEEHEKAVKRYQKSRRSDYRSSPQNTQSNTVERDL